MFNKSDAKKFVKEEKKDIYQKIQNKVSEEDLIKFKNAFENNVNRTYKNMSKTIDDGLKKNVSSLMDVYQSSRFLPITTKISFFIRNISGFKALTKIVKEYNNDYEMKIVSSNVISCPNPVDIHDIISRVDHYLIDLDSNNLQNEDIIEIYKNEDDLTKKVLTKLYNINSIELQVMFTSKFNLEDLFNDENKQMKKEENVVDNIFNNIGNNFTNVGNDIAKAIRYFFGIPSHNFKYKYDPNGYHYFYTKNKQ